MLNALPAWAATRHLHHVPLWTAPLRGTGLFTDTLGTLLILPFVTTLLCTLAVRREGLERLWLPPRLTPLLRLPDRLARRAAAFAALTFCAVVVPATAALALATSDGLGRGAFIAYKTALGVVLGAVVTPLIALRAMAEGS